MYKKLLALLMLISVFAQAMEVPQTCTPSASISLPELKISPGLFGLKESNSSEYLCALNHLAQLLLAHHKVIHECYKKINPIHTQLIAAQKEQERTLVILNKLKLDQAMAHNTNYRDYVNILRQVTSSEVDQLALNNTYKAFEFEAISLIGLLFILKNQSLISKKDLYTPDEISEIQRLYTYKENLGGNIEIFNLIQFMKNKSDSELLAQQRAKYIEQTKELTKKIMLCKRFIHSRYPQLSKTLQSFLDIIENALKSPEAYASINLQIPKAYEPIARQLKLLVLKNKDFLRYAKTQEGDVLPLSLEEVTTPSKATPPITNEKPAVSKTKKNTAKKKQNKPSLSKVEAKKEVVEEEIVQENMDIPTDVAPIAEKSSVALELATKIICDKTDALTVNQKKSCIVEPRQYQPAFTQISSLLNIPYDDGSIIEKNELVTINDPCNQMRIALYATDNNTAQRYTKNFSYTQNIIDWFKDPSKSIVERMQLDRSNKKFVDNTIQAKNKALRIHRFSKLVDKFLPTMGVVHQTPSRITHTNERCVVIPGHIELSDTKQEQPCYFVYIINQHGECFHRNIEFTSRKEMALNFMQKGFFEVEFPALPSKE